VQKIAQDQLESSTKNLMLNLEQNQDSSIFGGRRLSDTDPATFNSTFQANQQAQAKKLVSKQGRSSEMLSKVGSGVLMKARRIID
jgi:hypothetical protein